MKIIVLHIKCYFPPDNAHADSSIAHHGILPYEFKKIYRFFYKASRFL